MLIISKKREKEREKELAYFTFNKFVTHIWLKHQLNLLINIFSERINLL